jgi:hypothetical protein
MFLAQIIPLGQRLRLAQCLLGSIQETGNFGYSDHEGEISLPGEQSRETPTRPGGTRQTRGSVIPRLEAGAHWARSL